MGKFITKWKTGGAIVVLSWYLTILNKTFKELFTTRLHNIKYDEVYEIEDSNKVAIDRTPEERDDVETLLDTMENIFN